MKVGKVFRKFFNASAMSAIVVSVVVGTSAEARTTVEGFEFSDAFEGDTIKMDWEFIRGTWAQYDGVMRQSDNYWEGGYPHSGGVFALVGNTSMRDYTVSADIRSDDDDRMGLVFRFQDEENFYAFSWDRELSERALVRVHQGKEDVLMSDTVLYDPATWYAVRITLEGNRIRCDVDGVNVFDITDDAIQSGKTGLYNNGNDGGYFDNFIVMGSAGDTNEENVFFSDAFVGDTIKTDWEFIRGIWTLSDGAMRQSDNYWEGGYPHSGGVFALVGNTSMRDYTVSADIRSDDDDRMGLVFRFQDEENFYAFSWDRELNERALVRVHQGKEDVLMSDTVPYDPGTWYAVRITLEGNRIRCAVDGINVFDVTDDAIPSGKTGLYNNGNDGGYFDNFIVMGSAGDTNEENVFFSDAFEGDTIKTDWEFIRGTWTLSDGAMRQSDNYWEWEYPHSGGVFALVGNIAMKNYTVTTDIRSDDDDRMGLVFRFQDEENFYAFSWDRELNERALVRVHMGKEEVLMSDAVPYDPGTWYAVRINLEGNRIRCAVDGINVFDVTDDAIQSGKTGLYNNGNDGGYFDNFIVTMGKDSTVDVTRDVSPVGFSVGDPYPNPFNPFVTIDITVPEHSNVTIAIYDVLGRRVNILHNGYLTPGSHRVTWDGRDSSGTPVGSGLYIYRVMSGMFARHGKMTLLR